MKIKVLNGNPSGKAQRFWNMTALNETDAEITLYGDVVSRQPTDWWTGEAIPGQFITPEGFAQDLELIRGKQNVTVKINSCGGDLYTGIAIHNALKGLEANITTVVEGIAASAASVIAMAGDTVSVFPGSLIMIHGVSVYNYDGMNLQDVKKIEQMMDANERAIAEIYHAKTGIECDKLRNMMAKEKWMTGQEAVDLGFADNVIEDAAETQISMSANKKFLIVNGIVHNSAYFKSMPDFPVQKPAKPQNSAKPTNKPDANKKENEGGKKVMNLDELRAQYPDLVAEIENAARNSVDVAAAIATERSRIADIDSIAASIPDQAMVNEAKYGESACTAQELSFRVLQNSARQGAQFLTAMQADNAVSGTEGVGAAPVNGTEPVNTKEADEAELKTVFDAFNKMRGVSK